MNWESWNYADWKKARLGLSISASCAAKAIGISPRMIFYFESGKRKLSRKKLLALAQLVAKGDNGETRKGDNAIQG